MGVYSKYLICYDVENNRTRKKLFDAFKDLGLEDIQKSVFYGDLRQADFKAMKSLVRKLLNEKTDRCLWVQCSLDEEKVRDCFGYKNFKWVEPDEHDTI